ncbi:MAG: hypothetical protein AAGE01_07225 [Pseudomonadota bacterium]
MRIVLFVLLFLGSAAAAQVPHVNWENHPTRALDLSPDRRTLAVANSADARVQLFDVSEGSPVPIGHVKVGIDPVSVRFRTDSELWVANHISDSVSIVDIDQRTIIATLATLDEPADIVFAGSPQRAFVSCSQANTIQVFDPMNLALAPEAIAINAEDPRALVASPDGSRVYVAIFESGNATTVLGGGIEDFDVLNYPPNVTRRANTPHGGQNPPPNDSAVFFPPMNADLPAAPRTGLIVRKDAQGRWMDDNSGDWSNFVSGGLAFQSGRLRGWDLPDRDIAIIDADTLSVDYTRSLMNIGMAIGFNPGTSEVTMVGTDAINEVRFEPVLNGRFLRVNLARVAASGGEGTVSDLNPHLDYTGSTVPLEQRRQSIGDPRAIVWNADGSRGYVVGLGSNNVIAIDAQGGRVGQPLTVGEGPAGLAIDPARERLYVWNHFEATLSTIDTDSWSELGREAVFNPLPSAIV